MKCKSCKNGIHKECTQHNVDGMKAYFKCDCNCEYNWIKRYIDTTSPWTREPGDGFVDTRVNKTDDDKKKEKTDTTTSPNIEFYPSYNFNSNNDYPLYYIEFNTYNNEEHWRLFKRNFIYTNEEWNKIEKNLLMSREGHPYQLADGIVNNYPNVIRLDTKNFLKFVVDALNEKVYNDKLEEINNKICKDMVPLTAEEQHGITEYFWTLMEDKKDTTTKSKECPICGIINCSCNFYT